MKTKIVTNVFTLDGKEFKPVPYGILFMIAIFTVAAIFLTFLTTRINTVSREIADLNTQLAEIRCETAQAKADIFQKKDITEIRAKAEEMGMVHYSKLPSHYLHVATEDKIIVLLEEDDDTQDINLGILLSALRTSIYDFVKHIADEE